MFGGLYGNPEQPDGKSAWVWSARLNVRYIGFNQVEDKSVIVDHIVAADEEQALEIARNMYDSVLQKEWPELLDCEVEPVMKFNAESHKGYSPTLRSENWHEPYDYQVEFLDHLLDPASLLGHMKARIAAKLDPSNIAGTPAPIKQKKNNGGKP